MKRNSNRLGTLAAAATISVTALSGCGPLWYGPPPPGQPPGYAPGWQSPPMQSTPLSAPAPVIQQAPQPTFEGGGGTPGWNSTDLNNVPTVSPEEALRLPPAPTTSTWHDVQEGQTLSSIAQEYGVTVEALAEKNYLEPNSPVQPGQPLLIPK